MPDEIIYEDPITGYEININYGLMIISENELYYNGNLLSIDSQFPAFFITDFLQMNTFPLILHYNFNGKRISLLHRKDDFYILRADTGMVHKLKETIVNDI